MPDRRPLLLLFLLGVLALAALVALAVVGPMSTPHADTYQNDDYAPPPASADPPRVPMPASVAQAQDWILRNKLYTARMVAPVRCEVGRIDPRVASSADLQAHLEDMVGCLLRDWAPAFEQSGFVLVRTPVIVYGSQITTPCGDKNVNAMYCEVNQQIYYSRYVTTEIGGLADNPWATEMVIAHEFGHAVQGRSGIFVSTYFLETQELDRHAQLLLNRRLENQADCFSGLFLRSVSRSIGLRQSDLPMLLDIYTQLGSDALSGQPDIESNHGLSASRRYWGQLGLGTDEVGVCNTYLAGAEVNR